MDLFAQIDGYCERTDPSFWSEPVNALTNAAFLIAAFVMWRRCRWLPLGRVLAGILAAIGLGSFLFHTFATGWAALADVTPIAAFILVYVFAANRDFWGLGPWASAAGAALFIPYAAVFGAIFAELPFFRISAAYWPVALLILVYAILLRGRDPGVARGLGLGAGILVLSLVSRSIDELVCPAVSLGTHFIWHCLNGLMLGWMIEVWRRARMTAQPG
ncbi:MAG: ceramidase domain-containing protein [Pseudomonadota bacterium]